MTGPLRSSTKETSRKRMPQRSKLFDRLDSYINDSRNEFETKLAEIVEIPTVSMDPERKDDCKRGAHLVRQFLESIGAKAEVVKTPGNPVVRGRIETGKNNPTITIYNHIDVQPADPEEWHKAPFTFFKQDGRYEGRGTTDDKGPALSAMMAARFAAQNGVPLNIN